MAERRVAAFEFTEQGLINDIDVEFTSVRFARWEYDGKGPEITALVVKMKPVSGGDEVEQAWSVGGEDDFMPSKDGSYLVAAGDRTSLAKGSNYQILIQSIENCLGESLDGEVTKLEGMQCHILRVPAPKRENLKNQRKRSEGDGPERERTILTVSDVKSVPWEKGAKKKNKPAKAKDEDADEKGSGSSSDSSSDDAEEQASMLLKKVILKAGGEMDADDVGYAVYTAAPKDKALRKQISDLANDPKWVSKVEGVTVKDGKVSLDE